MTRRPDLESRLDSLPGATWSYERRLPVADIDLPASANLQYRLEPVDQPTVDRYAADMARGDRFPAIIVRRTRGSKLHLLGGNHRRAAAHQAGISALAAYVVVCTAAQARQLAYEDNRTHGLPLKPAERAVLAARLVLFDGMPRPQAAATVGATDAQVAQAVAAERAAERAQGLGLSAAFAQQTIYNRALLGAIEDDGVFAEAAITVMAANMGGASTQRLCARIQAAATTADAYDRIEAVAASRNGHTGGRGVKRNDLTMLTDAVYALLDVDPAAAAGLVQIGDEQAWSDRIKRAALHLMAIDRAVTAPKTEAA